MNPEEYMRLCLTEAEKGLGKVSPNPLVGSVIVKNGQLLSKGYHQRFGGPHAEIEAIRQLSAEELQGSSLFVNLEPCSHHGKTPPCAEAIVKYGITEVFIGALDPNPLVAGKGVVHMEKNGVTVHTGILKEECLHLNRRFYKFHQQKKPYVIAKWAESKDGFIDQEETEQGTSTPISSIVSRTLVHEWRTQEECILIGANTVINDNPQLTVRHVEGKNPHRLIVDLKGTLSGDRKVFTIDDNYTLFTPERSSIKHVLIDPDNWVDQVLQHVYQMGHLSILVEGGTKTINAFNAANAIDEVRKFVSPNNLNQGLAAPRITFEVSTSGNIGIDLLEIGFL